MLIVKYNKYRTCNIPYIDRLLILTLSLTVYPFSPSEKELKQDNDLISFNVHVIQIFSRKYSLLHVYI